DGSWIPANAERYANAVKLMNQNGVTTLFLVVGEEMSDLIIDLKKGKEIERYKRDDGKFMTIDDFTMGHHFSAAGSTVEAILEAVPQFIVELQADLVEKAIRAAGFQ